MTPLAQKLLKQRILPQARRLNWLSDQMLDELAQAHCFECTDVVDMAKIITAVGHKDFEQVKIKGETFDMHTIKTQAKVQMLAARTSFLPSPNTWIEWLDREDGVKVRRAILLLEQGDGSEDDKKYIIAFDVLEPLSAPVGSPLHGAPITLGPSIAFCAGDALISEGYTIIGFKGHVFRTASELSDLGGEEESYIRVLSASLLTKIVGFLALINTPKIVGRTTHLPHIGLQKRLARAYSMPGKYPLQAWHEIKLHINIPMEFRNEQVEGHLTGMRALHFCRSYLRIRQGRLELVNWHWRGNPALGIRQTRYRVEP